MKKIILLITATLVVLPLSAQFKAKMFFTGMGKEHVFTIYSSDANYRYEFNEDGQAGVIIAKTGSSEIVILMPSQKMAMKASAENPMSMGSDPVKAYEYYLDSGIMKEEGKEMVNGVQCTKSTLWNKENSTQKMYTVWLSDQFKFPVKLINHMDGSGEGSIMELKDIEAWTPDAQSFEIPSGYQVMDMPQMNTY